MTPRLVDLPSFSAARWPKVKEAHRRFWDRTLGRPLIAGRLYGRDPGRPAPALPNHGFTSYHDPATVTAEAIVDRWDFDIACTSHIGDAFPTLFPNFGPGVIAAFMGCTLNNGDPTYQTTWFHPAEEKEIADLHFRFDPDAFWFRRILDINTAAAARWGASVAVGMTDLGGNLDIAASFRPSEKLLFDLYDAPEEVERIAWEAHEAWWAYFAALRKPLDAAGIPYSAWTPVLCEDPYYVLQCDFCYMIGPEMFDRFVKPELAASCRRLKHSIYHLDGPGQLPHLDSLLEIPELDAVQWVPGAGQPGIGEWPEVFRRIHAAGKSIQIFDSLHPDTAQFPRILDQIGSADRIAIVSWGGANDEEKIVRFLEKYGVHS